MDMFGERLRLRRKSRGLNQNQLAKLVGCTGHTISNYEQMAEKPNTHVAYMIVQVLGEF